VIRHCRILCFEIKPVAELRTGGGKNEALHGCPIVPPKAFPGGLDLFSVARLSAEGVDKTRFPRVKAEDQSFYHWVSRVVDPGFIPQ
jgi:hypothetical protein